jgi:hypothetical protein
MEIDDYKLPPTDPEGREEGRPRVVSDLFRKAVVSGVGALFMTEEGIRSLVKDLKLPKEVISSVMAQADRTKGEVVRAVGSELRAFLESTRVREDLLSMLTQLRFEVRAEVGIKRRDEASTLFEPGLDAKVQVKKRAPARAKAKPKTPAKPAASKGKKNAS